MKSATCNFTANSNIGRTNFDTHTLSSRDEVLISLDILLQVLLSSWCSERKVLVEDPGEGSGRPGPALSKGMDDRPPPLSQGLDPPLSTVIFPTHFIYVWLRTCSTISSWLERIRNSLICCRIQQKIHETHKMCSWLDHKRSSHKKFAYLL